MGWDWYTCPVYDSCPYQRKHQPMMCQEEASFSGGLVTICVASSLCRNSTSALICCDTSQVSSSHLSLIFLFPFQASTFTSTRSPGFKFMVPICSVIVPFLSMCFSSQLGLHLLQGAPQLVSHRSYINIHIPGRGLSHGGLIAANSGEDEVDWEPRPSSKH